jgi:hypothetical protein
MSDILDGIIDTDDFGEVQLVQTFDPLVSQARIPLANLEDAKREYQRLYNAYFDGSIPRDKARTCGYLLSGLLSLFKVEVDAELLKRMDSIEQELATMKETK